MNRCGLFYKQLLYNLVVNIVLSIAVVLRLKHITVERKRFADIFCGNGNVVTLVAKETAPKLNSPQHLHMPTETGFRIKAETGLDKWNATVGIVVMRNRLSSFSGVFDMQCCRFQAKKNRGYVHQ